MDFENNENISIQNDLEVTPDCLQQKMREVKQNIQIGQLVFDEWVENDEQIIQNTSFTQTITTQKEVTNEPSYQSLVSNQTTLIHPTATSNLYHLANQLQNQQLFNETHQFQDKSTKMFTSSQIQMINNKQINSHHQHHHQNQKSMHLPTIPKQPIPNIYKKHQYAQSISGSLNFKNTGYPFLQRSHTDFRVQKIDPNNDHISNSSRLSLNFENAIQPVILLCEYEKMKEEYEQKVIALQKLTYQLEKENALLQQSLQQKELEDASNLEREEIQKKQQDQMIKMYQDREDEQNYENIQFKDKNQYLKQEHQMQNDKLEQNHNTIQELYKQLNELQEVLLIKDKEFDLQKQQLFNQMTQNKLSDIEQQKQREMQEYIQSQTFQNQDILISKLKQENQLLSLEAQNKENQIQLQHMQILEQKIQQMQKRNEIEKEKAIKEALKPLAKDQVLMQKLLSEKNDSIRELRQEKASFDQKCSEFLKLINKHKRQQKATVIKYENIIKNLNERISFIIQRKKTDSLQIIDGQNQLSLNGSKIFKQQNLNSLRGRSSTITECFDHQNILGSDQAKNVCKHIKISGINNQKKGIAAFEEINYKNGANIKCVKLKIENKKAFNPLESIYSFNNSNIYKESIMSKQKQNQRPQSSTNKYKQTQLLSNQEISLSNYLKQNKLTRCQSRQLNHNKTQIISQSFFRNKQNTMKLPKSYQNCEDLSLKNNKFDVDLINIIQKEEKQNGLQSERDQRQQVYMFENECSNKLHAKHQEMYKNQVDDDRELAFDLTQTNRESQERKLYSLNEYNFDADNKKNKEYEYDAHNTLARNNQMHLSPKYNQFEFYLQNPNLEFEGNNKIQNYDQEFKQQSLQNHFQLLQNNYSQIELNCLNVCAENNNNISNTYINQQQLNKVPNQNYNKKSNNYKNEQSFINQIKIDELLDDKQNKILQTQGSEQYQLINFPCQNNEQSQFDDKEIQNQNQHLDNLNYNQCECCKISNQQCYKNYFQNFQNSLIKEKVSKDLFKETSNSYLNRKEITDKTEKEMIENRNIEKTLSIEQKNQKGQKEQIKNNEQHPTYLISQLYPSSRTAKTVQTDGMQHTTNNSDLITGEYDIPKLNIHTEKMPMCSQRNECIEQLELSSVGKHLTRHHPKTANIIANQEGQLFLISNQLNREKLHILNNDCGEYIQSDLEIENCIVESESKQTQNLSHRLSCENQIVKEKTLDLHKRLQQLEQIQSIKHNFKDITNQNAETYLNNQYQFLRQSLIESQTDQSPLKDSQIQNNLINQNFGFFREQSQDKQIMTSLNNKQVQKEKIMQPTLKNNNQNKKNLNSRKSESNQIKITDCKQKIEVDENKNLQSHKNIKKKIQGETQKINNIFQNQKGKQQNRKQLSYNYEQNKRNNNYSRYQQFNYNQNPSSIPEYQEQILKQRQNNEQNQNPIILQENQNKNILIEKLNKNNVSQEDFSFQQPHGYYQKNESVQIKNSNNIQQQFDLNMSNKQSESSQSSISQELCKIPIANEYLGGSFGMQDALINSFNNQNKSKSMQQQQDQLQNKI